MYIDRRNFKNEEKKIKKQIEVKNNLDKILNLIKQSASFDDLKNNPISYLYKFEPLKHNLKGLYSFNLNKNGGTIRLICSFDREKNIAYLESISMNHYQDIKVKINV